MTGAVFLDRDGVIIEDRADYVKSWDEVQFIPEAFDAIRRFSEAGLTVVIVTNQSAVGRGIVTQAFVEEIHSRMLEEIAAHGGKVDAVYFCPHHPTAGCECRKPKSGMLLEAAEKLGIDLSASVMVGDSLTDIRAANEAGARGILVLTGKGSAQASLVEAYVAGGKQPVSIVPNIAAAADAILNSQVYV